MPTPEPLSLEAIDAWCRRVGLARVREPGAEGLVIPRPGGPDIRVIARPERHMITLAILAPGVVDEDDYQELAAVIADLNARLYMGAWVLNAESGELYVRITLPTRGTMLPDEALEHVMRALVEAADMQLDEVRPYLADELSTP